MPCELGLLLRFFSHREFSPYNGMLGYALGASVVCKRQVKQSVLGLVFVLVRHGMYIF